MIQNNNDAPRPLRRYTNLPVLLDLLAEKRLTLVNPSGWVDKNDSFYLEQYRLGLNAKSVLALCLSEAGETFHHWHVFTQGSGGVCIEFQRESLIKAIDAVKTVRHGPVKYIPMHKAKAPSPEDLPFLKRFPYRDELEYRLVYVNRNGKSDVYFVPIQLDCIAKITLSPWLPKNLVKTVSKTICSVAGASVYVATTTLLDNRRWKNLSLKSAQPGPGGS